MNRPNLAPASPPPFRLPGQHFGAALIWLALVGAAAPWVAATLADGNLFAPPVLAATHALTLGVLTTMIFGALYQFFPATLGVGARSIRVAHWTFWTLQAGVLAIVVGFGRWWPGLLLLGWVLLFLAVGGLAWNLLPQRRKATQGHLVGRYVSLGHMALGLAMVLGLARIGEPLGWWTVSRTGFIAAHFHLAAFGFVTLTIVGVGSRMVPMFLFAQTAPTWPLTGLGPLAVVGLLLNAAGLLIDQHLLTRVGGAALILAGSLWVLQMGFWLRHRARREIDPGIAYLLAGTGFLIVTIVLGGSRLATDAFDPRGWAAYAVVTLLGWCTLFTLGIAHRIVPFLSWLHLFGGMSRGAHAPPVTALVHRGMAWASLVLLVVGIAAAGLGILRGHALAASIGGLGATAGIVAVVAQVVRGFWLWRSTPSDPVPTAPLSPRPKGRPLEVLS